MTQSDLNDLVIRYETFINDVLKEDLKQVDLRLQEVTGEITDLIQQKHSLKVITDRKTHPNGFKTQVNLGCNFFMEASVSDTSTLLMHIGLSHYLEFTTEEANRYLDVRIKAFEKKAEEIKNQGAEIKAHIKLMLFHMGEIQNKQTFGVS